MFDREALSLQQDAQVPITEPAAFVGHHHEPLSQDTVGTRLLVILERGAIQRYQLARPPLAQAVRRQHVPRGSSLGVGLQKSYVVGSFRAALSSMASAEEASELGVFCFQGAQPWRIGDGHATELRSAFMESGVADAILAAHLSEVFSPASCSRIMLLICRSVDLRFIEPILLSPMDSTSPWPDLRA